MTRGGETRFTKGTSGNPKGRPKKHRTPASAFDIVFDQTMRVTQGGVERDLTVDEALQLQTYHAALKGSRMAIRTILKMIEKREEALSKHAPARPAVKMDVVFDSRNTHRAIELLGIAEWGEPPHGGGPSTRPLLLATWAAQAGLSRPGRRSLSQEDRDSIRRVTRHPEQLKWPRRHQS